MEFRILKELVGQSLSCWNILVHNITNITTNEVKIVGKISASWMDVLIDLYTA